MILNLMDGKETVYLALILRSVAEEQPILEIMHRYCKAGKTKEALFMIRQFAESKLNHSDLAVVFEEIERICAQKGEIKMESEKS